MRRIRLRWQLYPSYLLITLLSLLTVVLYGSGALRDYYYGQTAADLQSTAWLLEEQIAGQLLSQQPDRVDALCKKMGQRLREKLGEELGQESLTRITVVSPSGEVIGDSEGQLPLENHADREEIRDALAGRIGSCVRPSPTLKQEMMYVAIPLQREGRTIGVLRTSIPVTAIAQALRAIQLKIAIAGLVVVLIAAAVSLFVSQRISRPLERLKRGAEQFARGDLTHKLIGGASQEIGALAEAINEMASELDKRIRTAVQERNQREAILSAMVEGVLAVDSRQHLISLNQAGARLLGVDVEAVLGRNLREVVRDHPLQNLVADVLSGGQPVEDDIVLEEGAQERYLHAQGTVLQDIETADAKGPQIGALVVLHDVTRLRRLERVRRDFVANVSHELKTPITSIKGFVETLLDGAMQQPEDAQRFLRIVAAQSDRLNGIIEDLLTLSRLERETEKAGIVLQRERIRDVLEAALGACELRASQRDIHVELACDLELQAEINAALLEQAVVNLVDNAVKYSPEGETVHLEATCSGSEVVICVRDRGCGIGPEHLPRLFERFYRVDKARSRKLGGTGLGLAIVKHIAQAHGGRATVESTPGEGSVFSLHLPS